MCSQGPCTDAWTDTRNHSSITISLATRCAWIKRKVLKVVSSNLAPYDTSQLSDEGKSRQANKSNLKQWQSVGHYLCSSHSVEGFLIIYMSLEYLSMDGEWEIKIRSTETFNCPFPLSRFLLWPGVDPDLQRPLIVPYYYPGFSCGSGVDPDHCPFPLSRFLLRIRGGSRSTDTFNCPFPLSRFLLWSGVDPDLQRPLNPGNGL